VAGGWWTRLEELAWQNEVRLAGFLMEGFVEYMPCPCHTLLILCFDWQHEWFQMPWLLSPALRLHGAPGLQQSVAAPALFMFMFVVEQPASHQMNHSGLCSTKASSLG